MSRNNRDMLHKPKTLLKLNSNLKQVLKSVFLYS